MTFNEWQQRHPIAAAELLNTVIHPDITEPNIHTTESAVQSASVYRGAQLGCFLGRNNNGAYSEHKPPSPGTRWGWCNDSKKINDVFKTPDLIGYYCHTVTPSDVGRTIAVFMGPEIKKPGWSLRPSDKRAAAQLNCINKIVNDGGIAGFVSHVDQIDKLILGWTG